MKKLINKIIVVATALLLLNTGMAFAQKNTTVKSDRIVFLNGSTKEGKVISFGNERIQFVHTGETLNYEFSKNEIEKIEYASGRIEQFTEKKLKEVQPAHVLSQDKIAVIPLHYIGHGNGHDDDMRFYLQDIVISYLSKSSLEYKLQDGVVTNALLFKNAITESNIRQYTPKELAAVLHVEYIILGSVLQDKGRIVTHRNNNNSRRETIEHRGHEIKIHNRNNNHGTSVTNQHIETHVSLSIYNEAGENIYTQSRQSLLAEADAYKNTIHYLLKRTPLCKR